MSESATSHIAENTIVAAGIGASAEELLREANLAGELSVFIYQSARAAIEKLSTLPAPILLCGFHLKDMDPPELISSVRTNQETSKTRILFISRDEAESARIEKFQVPPDDILEAPFTSQTLFRKIHLHLKEAKSQAYVNRQLYNVFLQAPVAVCVFKGPAFVVDMVNGHMLELWGKSEDEVFAVPFFDAMPEARNQGYELLLESVLRTGERIVADELPITLLRSGRTEKVYIKFVFEPLYDENGHRSGIMVVADDITQQVEVRQKVEESETRYKLAIEAADMGNFEWIIPKGEFIYSERLAHIFGYDVTTGLQHSDFSNLIHPDDNDIRLAAHAEAMEKGTLFYEARIVTPGSDLRWIRLNGKVVYKNGAPAKMYGTVLDITEHKLFSENLAKMVEERTRSLRQSEERYQRMIGEVRDYAIILLDTEGKIINWNQGAERIKGYRESEIVGKNFSIFYGEEDRGNGVPQKLIRHAIQHGTATTEGYRIRKDGSKFWGSIAITALHDNDNNVIGFSKVTRDLTERKRAEERMMKYNLELEAQNRELEQFAYVASHDLQEPLRKIQMFTELLRQNTSDPEISEKYFQKIASSAARMTELIRAVLNYSRLARNENYHEPTDLNHILEGVLVDFELLIEERKAKISFDQLPVISAIPLQISQLFSNLIGNSLKFAENSPEISIRSREVHYDDIDFVTNLRPDRTYLEIVISDNGIGFDEKYLSKIFTIFHRLNDRSVYSGTGIGLALCKKIIENHAGFITAKSAVGEGAAFYIYLPMLTEDASDRQNG